VLILEKIFIFQNLRKLLQSRLDLPQGSIDGLRLEPGSKPSLVAGAGLSLIKENIS